MSSLCRHDRRKFLCATVAAAVCTSGLVLISGAAEKPASNAHSTSAAGNTISFSGSELYPVASARILKGPHLGEIAFPLDGIDTGTVSLGGRGNPRDWESFNRSNNRGTLLFSRVALCVKERKGNPVTELVEAPVPPPYRGARGIPRESAEGSSFRGLRLISLKYSVGDPRFGSMALVTSAENTSQLLRWLCGDWGVFSQKAGGKSHTATLELKKGTLELSELRLKRSFEPKSVTATLAGRPTAVRLVSQTVQNLIQLREPVTLHAGGSLRVNLS